MAKNVPPPSDVAQRARRAAATIRTKPPAKKLEPVDQLELTKAVLRLAGAGAPPGKHAVDSILDELQRAATARERAETVRRSRAQSMAEARKRRVTPAVRDAKLRARIAGLHRRGLKVARITTLLNNDDVKIGRDRVSRIVKSLEECGR